ncbi:hypothetical protein ACPXCH_13340 [Streptomyces albogriseolus]|uniref:hypothetical protein n=1 Tax=Streptomyces albogriseolus TaxID=1887 RepID=UPI003CEA26CB
MRQSVPRSVRGPGDALCRPWPCEARRPPLQVGRARTADGFGEYLKGQVDEVQAYAGAFEKDDVIGLGWETDPCLC